MVDHHQTYKTEADQYDKLISYEDFQGNLLPTIEEIVHLNQKEILDLGAGTGRIARLVAPFARKVISLDISHAMIQVAGRKMHTDDRANCMFAVSDNRFIPLADRTVDMVISGWSICYLFDWFRDTWRHELDLAFGEMRRVIRSGGQIMIIETQGTGFEFPHPPGHIRGYFDYLGKTGFNYKWIRTDYRFPNLETAIQIAGFFFGKELASEVNKNQWTILPECTGIWWGTAD